MNNSRLLLLFTASICPYYLFAAKKKDTKPNVVFIYADDLGMGLLSHYGQKYFTTPNLDRLFEEGMSFTRNYGCQYSAPARASMLTGYHDCNSGKWNICRGGAYAVKNIEEVIEEKEKVLNNNYLPLPENDLLLSQVFKRAGYVTGQIGKLEWGFTVTRQQMKDHEWDYYYGYLDHVRCHGFYPPFLFENGDVVHIEGNSHVNCAKTFDQESVKNYKIRWNKEGKKVYSQDLFIEKVIRFIRDNKDKPFFLYHPTQLPHGPVVVDKVHPALKEMEDLTEIEKEYASMVKMLDDHVGIIVEELKRLDILENTIIVFSSDNGHETYYSGSERCVKNRDVNGKPFDSWDYTYTSERTGDLLNGNAGMSGKKWSNLNGGVQVPLVFKWSKYIPEGVESNQLTANYDLITTFADLLGIDLEVQKDGESILPILIGGKKKLRERRYVHVASPIGNAVIDSDGWKLRYNKVKKEYRLFYLPKDYKEEIIMNDKAPKVLERLKKELIH